MFRYALLGGKNIKKSKEAIIIKVKIVVTFGEEGGSWDEKMG